MSQRFARGYVAFLSFLFLVTVPKNVVAIESIDPKVYFEWLGGRINPQSSTNVQTVLHSVRGNLATNTENLIPLGGVVEDLWANGSANAQLGILSYLIVLSTHKKLGDLLQGNTWQARITESMRQNGFPKPLQERLIQSASKYKTRWAIGGGVATSVFVGLLGTVFYFLGVDNVQTALMFASPCFDVGAGCMLPMAMDAPLREGETELSRMAAPVAMYLGYVAVKYTSFVFTVLSPFKWFKWFFRTNEMKTFVASVPPAASESARCPFALAYNRSLELLVAGEPPTEIVE